MGMAACKQLLCCYSCYLPSLWTELWQVTQYSQGSENRQAEEDKAEKATEKLLGSLSESLLCKQGKGSVPIIIQAGWQNFCAAG